MRSFNGQGQAVALCLTLLAVLAPTAAAQDDPHTCKHEAFEAFAFLEGEWVVASRYRNGEGRWEETEAQASISYDLEGCLLLERYAGSRGGVPFSARAVMTYNVMAGQLQRAWVDSGHGLLVLYEGNATAEGLFLEYEMQIRDRLVRFQHVYTDISNASFRMVSRRSNDGGQTWDTGWFLTFTRKP